MTDFYSIRINDQWRIIFKWEDPNSRDLAGPFLRKYIDFNILSEQFRQKILYNKNRLNVAELKTKRT
jgi:formylmethanofuran dehydrogenase subunit A